MIVNTIPTFSRIEIKHGDKQAMLLAATELKALAGELEFIAGQKHDDETANVLAHHKIRSASNKLRNR